MQGVYDMGKRARGSVTDAQKRASHFKSLRLTVKRRSPQGLGYPKAPVRRLLRATKRLIDKMDVADKGTGGTGGVGGGLDGMVEPRLVAELRAAWSVLSSTKRGFLREDAAVDSGEGQDERSEALQAERSESLQDTH
jgi:hypothetical protein